MASLDYPKTKVNSIYLKDLYWILRLKKDCEIFFSLTGRTEINPKKYNKGAKNVNKSFQK